MWSVNKHLYKTTYLATAWIHHSNHLLPLLYQRRMMVCTQIFHFKMYPVIFMTSLYLQITCKHSVVHSCLWSWSVISDVHNFSNQVGGWSTKGVMVDESLSNETSVTCLTRHLTSFAVLVKIRDTDETQVRANIVTEY